MSTSAAVLSDNSTPAPLAVDSSTAARMIGVAPGTLNNWRTRGLGPTYVRHGLPGSRILYRVSDLQAWLDANVVGGKK